MCLCALVCMIFDVFDLRTCTSPPTSPLSLFCSLFLLLSRLPSLLSLVLLTRARARVYPGMRVPMCVCQNCVSVCKLKSTEELQSSLGGKVIVKEPAQLPVHHLPLPPPPPHHPLSPRNLALWSQNVR